MERGEKMTRIGTVMGDLYTELKPFEVRQYLAKGSSAGAIAGFANADGTAPGFIAVKNIVFIYEEEV